MRREHDDHTKNFIKEIRLLDMDNEDEEMGIEYDDHTKNFIRKLRSLEMDEEGGDEFYNRSGFYAYVSAIKDRVPSSEIHLAINMKSLPDPTNRTSSSKLIISKNSVNYDEIRYIVAKKLSARYLEKIIIFEPIEIRRRDNPPRWWDKYEGEEIDRKRKPTKSKIVRKTPKKVIKKCKCKR